MRVFVFVCLLTATFGDTNPCPYLVTNDHVDGVWSCGSGTRPCSANAVAGWEDACPTTEAQCTDHCWTGSLCRECVCQDGLVPDTSNTDDRLECIEPESSNYTLLVSLASYGAILVLLLGFFVKTITN